MDEEFLRSEAKKISEMIENEIFRFFSLPLLDQLNSLEFELMDNRIFSDKFQPFIHYLREMKEVVETEQNEGKNTDNWKTIKENLFHRFDVNIQNSYPNIIKGIIFKSLFNEIGNPVLNHDSVIELKLKYGIKGDRDIKNFVNTVLQRRLYYEIHRGGKRFVETSDGERKPYGIEEDEAFTAIANYNRYKIVSKFVYDYLQKNRYSTNAVKFIRDFYEIPSKIEIYRKKPKGIDIPFEWLKETSDINISCRHFKSRIIKKSEVEINKWKSRYLNSILIHHESANLNKRKNQLFYPKSLLEVLKFSPVDLRQYFPEFSENDSYTVFVSPT